MAADAVTLAYVHPDRVDHNFHESLTKTLMFDASRNGRLLRGKYLAQFGGSTGVTMARNVTVKSWLDSGNYDADWLWWVDSDMGWSPDALERLMTVADKDKRPIVGGLCFGLRHSDDDGLHGRRYTSFPTVYDLAETDERVGFAPRYNYPTDTLQQVAATGSAFLVVHRSVFTRIRDAYGDHWYDNIPHPKAEWPLGEDVSFCLRAATLDIPVYVHTGIKTNHHKEFYVDEALYLTQRAAPPPVERCAVIVPVMRRPQNAEPFMRSLRASTGLASVYAVAHESDFDTISAWEAAGAWVLQTDEHGFAPKANVGYRETNEPWLFLVGDDVQFREGWYDRALRAAGDRFHVVATNDCGNPRVLAGMHATHPLIRRSYIDEHGASWDGPGVVCHEGYHHWYVDDEWTTKAMQDGVFTYAPDSVVDHLHPIWGKGVEDDTYKRGTARADKDRRLFERRLRDNTQARSKDWAFHAGAPVR